MLTSFLYFALLCTYTLRKRSESQYQAFRKQKKITTKSMKLQLHMPNTIQTTGNKKPLLQGPKLTT